MSCTVVSLQGQAAQLKVFANYAKKIQKPSEFDFENFKTKFKFGKFQFRVSQKKAKFLKHF